MNQLGDYNLKRAAIFSDIHFGKKAEIHNKDCLDFIHFLYDYVSNKDNGIDHIIFMGDWFDKRDAINVSALNYSYKALSVLNSLGIPIFFIIGNHDLYLRNTRDVHSSIFFKEFSNIHLIDTPTRATISGLNILFLPYIFKEEYVPLAVEVNASDVVFAHLELKGFVLTGTTVVLEHGHDQALFDKPKRIFTGHFHKRQSKGNVTYTGNPFPFDFSDTNDTERGFAVYDYASNDLSFQDNLDAPSYIKTTLSKLLQNHKKLLKPKGVVRCFVDMDVSMEESVALKEKFVEKYKLRGCTLEETGEDFTTVSAEVVEGEDIEEKFETTDTMIRSLLENLKDLQKLNKQKIIKIYEDL